MRTAPPATRCKCGGRVRTVASRRGDLVVDEEPVKGGPFIVNVDTVVLRQVTHSTSLGFCQHRCWTSRG